MTTLSASSHNKGGRPSKGDRRPFKTRVRRDVAQRIFEESAARGIPMSDYIEIILAQYHGADVAMPEPVDPSEQLPMTG